MYKIFVDSAEPQRIFSWKFVSYKLINYETNFSFMRWWHWHTVQVCTSEPVLVWFQSYDHDYNYNNSAWWLLANVMQLNAAQDCLLTRYVAALYRQLHAVVTKYVIINITTLKLSIAMAWLNMTEHELLKVIYTCSK